MTLVNFSHPLTDEQRARLREMLDVPEWREISVQAHFDAMQPFASQTTELVNAVGLSAQEWQTDSIVVVPPSFAAICASVVAELLGRMGYLPTIVRFRPVENSAVPRFEPAEAINLQAIRERARSERAQ